MKLKQILWVTILSGTIGWLSAAMQAQPEPPVDTPQTDNPSQSWQSNPPAPGPRDGNGPRWNRQQRRNALQQDNRNPRANRPRRNQTRQDNLDQRPNRLRQGNQAQAGPARGQGRRGMNRQQFGYRDFSERPLQRQGIGRGQGFRQDYSPGPLGPRPQGQGWGQGRGRDVFRGQDVARPRDFQRDFAPGRLAGQGRQAFRGFGDSWGRGGQMSGRQPYGYGPERPRGRQRFDAQQGPNFRGSGRGQGWQNRRGFGGPPDGYGPRQFQPQRRGQGFAPRGNQGFGPGRDAFQSPRGNRPPYRRMQEDVEPEMIPPAPLTEGPDEFIAPEEDFPYFEESAWSDDMEI